MTTVKGKRYLFLLKPNTKYGNFGQKWRFQKLGLKFESSLIQSDIDDLRQNKIQDGHQNNFRKN